MTKSPNKLKKQKLMKSTLKISVFCSVLLTVSLATFAQFSGGNGTENNPYMITTPAELAQLATYVNDGNTAYNDKHYKLGNDLDLSAYQTGSGWNPIGSYSYGSSSNKSFNGVFDGNNKVISNLKITDRECCGLFGFVLGTVKNTGVSVNINLFTEFPSHYYIGGIAGCNGGNVSNCYSTGLIYVNINSVGTWSAEAFAGGIVGFNQIIGSVSNCYATSAVSTKAGDNSCAGGIVGHNRSGSILNCYSTSMVSSNGDYSYAGGISGGNANGGKISNCAALNPSLVCTGTNKYFGRIAGENSATLANNIAFDKMLNPDGGTTWSHTGASNIDGESITVEVIHADGTLGGRFTGANGWTTQNGKLPGLFGNTVNIPEHLRLPGYPYITTTTLPNGMVGTAYNETLTVISETPVTWSVESGNLPGGLTLTAGGVIVGVPSNAGIYKFTIKATNAVSFHTQSFVIYVFKEGYPLITTESLPNGAIDELYQQSLSAISDLPVSWLLESGKLPDGLALSSDGIILGVPTTNGLFTFTVKANNGIGFDTKQMTINIGNVGISDNYAANVKVFPNPTNDKFVAEIDGTVTVKLYDILGKEVLSHTAIDKKEINISHIQKGVYSISILSDGKIIGNSKIVKQ